MAIPVIPLQSHDPLFIFTSHLLVQPVVVFHPRLFLVTCALIALVTPLCLTFPWLLSFLDMRVLIWTHRSTKCIWYKE